MLLNCNINCSQWRTGNFDIAAGEGTGNLWAAHAGSTDMSCDSTKLDLAKTVADARKAFSSHECWGKGAAKPIIITPPGKSK